MSDYRIWNADSCKNMTIDEQAKHLGVAALYLGIAADLASDCYYKSAWEATKIADIIGRSGDSELYDNLAHAVKIYIAYHEDKYWYQDEMYYQGLFNKYAPDIIEGCKIIEGINDRNNIPDVWVEVGGESIPVEVKLNSFNERALQQLERYIKAFGAKNGIAVGRTLDVELPNNITFISNDVLDELDMERKDIEQRDLKFEERFKEITTKAFERWKECERDD